MKASESGSRRSSSRQHLVGRVAAARAVALHLPLAPQLLGRRQVDAHVEEPPQLLGVVAEQPLDDRELLRVDADERPEGAVLVLVDRLQDRLGAAHVREVLRHDVHVVALGIERRDVPLGPLAAVVAVVVVDADVRDVLLAEHADEPAREGRLAGRRVADDAEDDRASHAARLSYTAPRTRQVVVVLGLAVLGEDAALRGCRRG